MKKINKTCAWVLMGTMLLAGCGSTADNSKGYVKGLLDVAYGKGVEDYVQATGVKEADAETYSSQALKSEVNALQAYYGMDTEGTDKTEETLEEVCRILYEKTSYEIKEKDGKAEVTIQPVTALESEAVTGYVDSFNVKEFVDGDQSCTDEAFAEGLLEVLKSEGVEVSDKKTTITVTVTEKDKKPYISDEDLQKLDEAILIY